MTVMKSTTPNATAKAASNRRGLVTTGVIAGAALLALYGGRPWLGYSATPNATKPTVTSAAPAETVADSGDLAVGDTLAFDSAHGKVLLSVQSVDGDTVTVTDADGDEMTVNREMLTGGTLPASNTEANADHMMAVIAQRAASGYYVRHAGVNGAHGK
jgi:hypothetical protein